MKLKNGQHNGFTLIELLVSMGIFAILSVIIYGTFTTVTNTVAKVSEANALTDKAQRILSFMEDDLRSVGFGLGAYARVPYCTGSLIPPTDPNVLAYTSGNPYDTLTFLTSFPIPVQETSACMAKWNDCNGVERQDYYLTTTQSDCSSSPRDGAEGNDRFSVHVGISCYDDVVALSGTNNARSLVTFESWFQSDQNKSYYFTADTIGITMTLPSGSTLPTEIPDNSTVYAIRQYRYDVDTAGGARSLRRVGWKATCAEEPVTLVAGATAAGGVDGLKFEFITVDESTGTYVTSPTMPMYLNDLRSVVVWLLVRSDKLTQGYTNSDQYILGSTTGKITLGPYNDGYRRVLVHKTVGVKNLAKTN